MALFLDRVFQFISAKVLIHTVAGTVGGVVTIALLFPLESLRTRLQVGDRTILRAVEDKASTFRMLTRVVREEGLLSLYRGLWAVLVSMAVSCSVYFYAYSYLKQALLHYSQQDSCDAGLVPAALSVVASFAVATSAGILNVLVTTPLWVVNSRIRMQQSRATSCCLASKDERFNHVDDGLAAPWQRPYAGLIDGLIRVRREEGAASLWSGIVPSLILVSNPVLVWVVYEKLRWLVLVWHAEASGDVGDRLPGMEAFFLGAVAKIASTLLTYPFQVAQARLCYDARARPSTLREVHQKRDGPARRPCTQKEFAGTIDCLRCLYRESGMRGWYQGLEAKLWQTVLTAALQFSLHEQLAAFFFSILSAGASTPPALVNSASARS